MDYEVPPLSISLSVLRPTLTEGKACVWDSANPYTHSSIKATLTDSLTALQRRPRLETVTQQESGPALWSLTSNPSKVSVVNLHVAGLLWLPGN